MREIKNASLAFSAEVSSFAQTPQWEIIYVCETSERERVQSCNGSGVSKLAFCQGRHDAELRVRIKPLAPASVAACAAHL